MGRWSQYDEDEHRLPEGMKRVGYDADTQIYTYQDADGSYWEGAEGVKYGALRRVNTADDDTRLYARSTTESSQRTVRLNTDFTEIIFPKEEEAMSSNGAKDWRLFAPFLLLVGLSLLLLFRLLTARPASQPYPTCGEGETAYSIRAGDTCWAIAQKYEMNVEDLVGMNKGLRCETLEFGRRVCVWEM